ASAGGPIAEQAHAAGRPLIGLPGILQPRASVAYGVTGTLEVGIAAGIVHAGVREQLGSSAALLRDLVSRWGPDAGADALPKRLARDAHGRFPVTYGADLTVPVAYRWKTQINENAKVPAATAEIPESNHNEICGWENAGSIAEHTAWFLRDADQNERIARRIEINAKIVADSGARAEVIDTLGETRLERLFSAVLLGDLVSLNMGVLRGDDPSPVPIIEGLKDQLGRPASA
ncbi:MAG: SIS domain-containing protein, partial [Solirubrobacterales bacterium]